MDVMVHIDPEDDALAKPNIHLPSRDLLLKHLTNKLGNTQLPISYSVLHYLDGKVDAELFIDTSYCQDKDKTLELLNICTEITNQDEYFRHIKLYFTDAPK